MSHCLNENVAEVFALNVHYSVRMPINKSIPCTSATDSVRWGKLTSHTALGTWPTLLLLALTLTGTPLLGLLALVGDRGPDPPHRTGAGCVVVLLFSLGMASCPPGNCLLLQQWTCLLSKFLTSCDCMVSGALHVRWLLCVTHVFGTRDLKGYKQLRHDKCKQAYRAQQRFTANDVYVGMPCRKQASESEGGSTAA